MKTVALFMIVAPALTSVIAAQEILPNTQDSVATIQENIASGKGILVDTREIDEFKAGHIKGAVNLPKSQLDDDSKIAALVKKFDRSKIIYVCFRTGSGAAVSGTTIKKHGFDVRPLKLSYGQLIKAVPPFTTEATVTRY
jgi:rhodanese-related sulfurtransferase